MILLNKILSKLNILINNNVFILLNVFLGALYCVVPPHQDKNLMIIKNEPDNDLKEQKPFHRQVI